MQRLDDAELAFIRRARADPAWWAKVVLGVDLWAKQVDMMVSVRDHDQTAVKACHAPGKTFTAAVLALWFLTVFYESKVLITAPTWNQVNEVLFPLIRSLHKKANYEIGGRWLQSPPKLILDDEWFLLGLSPKEPEAFAGWHAPHMLVICDEASGIPKKIMEAIRGILMGGRPRLLLLGNPTKPEGALYDAFHSARDNYNLISISCFDTPNFVGLKELYDACKSTDEKVALLKEAPQHHDKLINARAVAGMLAEYGPDSQVFKVRALAEFPSSSPDQLMELWQLEECVARWRDLKDEQRWWAPEQLPNWELPIYAGLDPSRMGNNRTSLAAQSAFCWAPIESYHQTDTIFCAARAAEFYAAHRAQIIKVDECGNGGGPLDLLLANPYVNALGVINGAAAKNTVRFANLRAETYWGLRDLVRTGVAVLPPNERLIGQLATIKYKYRPNGQILIEAKEDMLGRNVASPDEADAVVLSMSNAEEVVAARAVGKRTNWGGLLG